MNLVDCERGSITNRRYLCQIPYKRQHPGTQHLPLSSKQLTRPTLPNVTTTSGRGLGWSAVTCPRGHVTHTFMACDQATLCWAGSDVTFSLSPESWALPTSQSCPVELFTRSLPPSFLCGSELQRVPYSLVCDHQRDCLDGSDETFCTFPPCKNEFRCLNKEVCLLPASMALGVKTNNYFFSPMSVTGFS